MIDLAWLVPFFPLLGALAVAAFGRWWRENSHWPVILGIGAAFVASMALLQGVGDGQGRTVVYEWLHAGDLSVPIELRVDGLTTMMLAMVTFVATLVAIFAAGYMHGDPGYPRFFALVGLFVFSMTGLVLSSNYVVTYAFWEGVGVCSYLLIGFWYAKPEAAVAAKKAFLVNRLGDIGFAVAIFWIYRHFGTLSYDVVLDPGRLAALPESTRLGIALLLFWAATAKSAQVPLYVWLPDAMEGPTPVSALIHAATMVTAGVYLIARSSLLLVEAPAAQLVVCVVGCVTALLAALIALTQTDLKRVLAYSTVSQLGYMFMGLGAGIKGVAQLAIVAAMFHLFTHAFFKALLFLGSGSVMHAMGGVIDMRRFRGLRHRLPFTCWTFAVGGLALAGIPPLAGFWSKDEILTALKLASHEAGALGWGGAYTAIYWVAVATALLTAFYTGRAFFLTFFGPEKLPSPDNPEAEPAVAHGLEAHGAEVDPHRPADLPPPTVGATDEPVPASADHAHAHDHGHGGHDDHFGHESPPIMWVPLVILAVCAFGVGLLFGPLTGRFERLVLERTPGFDALPHVEHAPDYATMIVGSLVGLVGLAASWWMYARPSDLPAKIAGAIGPLYTWSRRKFYVDELYDRAVVWPLRGIAAFSKFFDTYVVDGLVRLTAWLPRLFGRELLAPFQNGLLQYYAAVTALGVALLLVVLLMM